MTEEASNEMRMDGKFSLELVLVQNKFICFVTCFLYNNLLFYLRNCLPIMRITQGPHTIFLVAMFYV